MDYSYTGRDLQFYLDKKSIEKKVPLICNLELTYRCNLNCIHCYVVDKKTDKELSTIEVINILDKIVEAGCLWIRFTGGEPLLREDFTEIYGYAKKKGMIVTVLTNGTLISPKIVKTFLGMPPFCIEVSVYGASEKTYAKFCRCGKAYYSCIKGLKLLFNEGLSFEIKTTVTRINKEDIIKIRDLASIYGCKFRYDTTLYPRIDDSWFSSELILSPEEVVNLDLDGTLSKERLFSWFDLYSKHKGKLRPSSLYTCDAGATSFNIDPYGNMHICHMFPYQASYNLLKGSFKAGVEMLKKIRAQKIAVNSRCKKCKIYFLCNKCSAICVAYSHIQRMYFDYYCKIAELRAQALTRITAGEVSFK
jgi:radical SAM protein with 4Fe4S-binding SPASM domain